MYFEWFKLLKFLKYLKLDCKENWHKIRKVINISISKMAYWTHMHDTGIIMLYNTPMVKPSRKARVMPDVWHTLRIPVSTCIRCVESLRITLMHLSGGILTSLLPTTSLGVRLVPNVSHHNLWVALSTYSNGSAMEQKLVFLFWNQRTTGA